MTYSTSFSSNLLTLLLVFCAFTLGGCSGLSFSKPRITALQAAKASPQPANSGEIVWQAQVTGGTPPLNYEYRLLVDKREMIVQTGEESRWRWLPRNSGNFLISVRVKDAKGYSAVSDWVGYRINPVINRNSLIAFFPLENISGVKAPLADISSKYRDLLKNEGFRLLSEERLENFMYRHRVRYTGGIGSELAHALRDEEGVEAVFITSLESFDEAIPPKLALTSRLVLCRDVPEIVWIEGVGLTGEDTPGLLGLKRIEKYGALQEKALGMMLTSIQKYLAGERSSFAAKLEKIMPRDYYLATEFVAADHYKIAVVPFLNRYARRNAGFVVPLHFVTLLNSYENLEVIEPGLVREQLLKYRLIMQAGPSLAVADVLASDSSLSADLILSGYVFDYQDQLGTPKIDFSTRLFSGPKRKIVWWSRSSAAGDDGVYFFDVGRYRSTHVMLQEMVQAIGGLLFPQRKFRPEPSDAEFSDSTQH